jgi:hypothetical protein
MLYTLWGMGGHPQPGLSAVLWVTALSTMLSFLLEMNGYLKVVLRYPIFYALRAARETGIPNRF